MECAEDLQPPEEEPWQFNDAKQKAFSLILNSHCTRTMKNRIEEKMEFESVKHDDPLVDIGITSLYLEANDKEAVKRRC